MPRIRSLKPEHKQHRKVGLLTDRQYRLWVGMVTEADDEGRFVADATQLRALVFAYQPEATVELIADDLTVIEQTGMIHLYRVADTTYAHFPSWRDHQRIDRPGVSRLPVPTCCGRGSITAQARASRRHRIPRVAPTTGSDPALTVHANNIAGLSPANARERSRTLANAREGEEGRGEERIGEERIVTAVQALDAPATTDPSTKNGIPIPPKILERIPALRSWPAPEALMALWNFHAEEAGLPAAETLSDKRRVKAGLLLRQFPDWRWWNGTLSGVKRSAFLSGKVPPSSGHSKPFRADFDWIVGAKDGVENIVRLHDGKYT